MKKPRKTGAFLYSLNCSPHRDRGYCCPVGLVVDPIGVIVPNVPLLLKRLFVNVLIVPVEPVELRNTSLLERRRVPLTAKPVRLCAITVESTAINPEAPTVRPVPVPSETTERLSITFAFVPIVIPLLEL